MVTAYETTWMREPGLNRESSLYTVHHTCCLSRFASRQWVDDVLSPECSPHKLRLCGALLLLSCEMSLFGPRSVFTQAGDRTSLQNAIEMGNFSFVIYWVL